MVLPKVCAGLEKDATSPSTTTVGTHNVLITLAKLVRCGDGHGANRPSHGAAKQGSQAWLSTGMTGMPLVSTTTHNHKPYRGCTAAALRLHCGCTAAAPAMGRFLPAGLAPSSSLGECAWDSSIASWQLQ